MPELADVEIFTDGACRGNPGPGGWAAILRYREVEKELSGYDPDTTNNRMEMMAAIAGLEALKRPCRVRLYSDSQYLRDGITKWIHGWKRREWRTVDQQPVKNMTRVGACWFLCVGSTANTVEMRDCFWRQVATLVGSVLV